MNCCQPTQLHTYTEARSIIDYLVILNMSDFGANYILDHYIVANVFPFFDSWQPSGQKLGVICRFSFFCQKGSCAKLKEHLPDATE